MSNDPTAPRITHPSNPTDEPMNEHQPHDETHLIGEPTRQLPDSPFRVEPATPVPDDAVTTQPTAPVGPPPPDPASRRPDPVAHRPLVTVQKGPRPGTVLLGLLALVVAGYVIVTNVTGAQVDLARTGPSLVGALGILLLLVGIAGVVLGRRR